MGIHDRKYMTDNKPPLSGGSLPKTFTARFIIISSVLYFVDLLMNNELFINLGFYSDKVKDFEIWRIVTAFFFVTPTPLIYALITLFVF